MIIGLHNSKKYLTATVWEDSATCPVILYETTEGTIINLPLTSYLITSEELLFRAQRVIVKEAITFKKTSCLKPGPLIYRLIEFVKIFYPEMKVVPITVYSKFTKPKNLIYPITWNTKEHGQNWFIKSAEVISKNETSILRESTSKSRF